MFVPASGVEKCCSVAIAPDESDAASNNAVTMLIFFILCTFFIVLSLSPIRRPGNAASNYLVNTAVMCTPLPLVLASVM